MTDHSDQSPLLKIKPTRAEIAANWFFRLTVAGLTALCFMFGLGLIARGCWFFFYAGWTLAGLAFAAP